MAVQVFVKDESGEIRDEWINPKHLQGKLQAGWKLDPADFVDTPTFEEADTNGSGALSVDEVREAAKEAGIDGWETKRIKTLKRELGYADED